MNWQIRSTIETLLDRGSRQIEPIQDYVSTLANYITATNKSLPEAEMQQNIDDLVRSIDPEPGSWGDKWIKRGHEAGLREGLNQGELRGQVRLLQRMLNLPIFSEEDFEGKDNASLRELIAELEARFANRD